MAPALLRPRWGALVRASPPGSLLQEKESLEADRAQPLGCGLFPKLGPLGRRGFLPKGSLLGTPIWKCEVVTSQQPARTAGRVILAMSCHFSGSPSKLSM